jgi:hypothetical protein
MELLKHSVNGSVDVKIIMNGVPPSDLAVKATDETQEHKKAEGELTRVQKQSKEAIPAGAVPAGKNAQTARKMASEPEAEDDEAKVARSPKTQPFHRESPSLLSMEESTDPEELERREQALKKKEEAVNKREEALAKKESAVSGSATASILGNDDTATSPSGFFNGIIRPPLDLAWGTTRLPGVTSTLDNTLVPNLLTFMQDAMDGIDVEITFELPTVLLSQLKNTSKNLTEGSSSTD